MNITVITCEKCGAKLTIETDDAAYREKKKTAFEKKHAKCKRKDGKRTGNGRETDLIQHINGSGNT